MRWRVIWEKLRVKLDIDLNDVFVFAGLAALTYGIAQMHAPSAWIVAGGVIFLIGLRR